MTAACNLCGEIINRSGSTLAAAQSAAFEAAIRLRNGQPARPTTPPIVNASREILVESQPQQPKSWIDFMELSPVIMHHVATRHPEVFRALMDMAAGYHAMLAAKLFTSTDPNFNKEVEEARRLAYWTMAGRFEFDRITPARLDPAPTA